MLFWHLAATTFLFRWIFRDPKVDMRFLLLGAVLPDLIDLGTVTVLGGPTGELWAHSLLAPSAVAIAVVALTRRGRRRRAWMALVVAWLFHLLIDRMWLDASVFLWPWFGVGLEVGGGSFWPGAWRRALSDPWRWLLEVGGLTYLTWIFAAHGLRSAAAWRELARTGRLGNRPDRG